MSLGASDAGVKSAGKPEVHTDTVCVWGAEEYEDGYNANPWQRCVSVPVAFGVSFGYGQSQKDLEEWHANAALPCAAFGEKAHEGGYFYGRTENPTVKALESKLACLEGAENALCFSAGLAAISAALYSFCSPPSAHRVVSIKDSYGGTSKLFLEFLPQMGVDVSLCTTSDHDAIEKEIRRADKRTTVVYLESPTNPTMKVLDLVRLVACAKEVGALVLVDNTFATPINQNPLALGADVVLHSLTKFLGGHGDALGGAVCGSRKLLEKVFHYRELHGGNLGPMEAYLILRGVKTLHLRMARHNANAMAVARFLEGHPKVKCVHYPGLESHPGHEIARSQMAGFGGMLSFELKDSSQVKQLLGGLCHVHCAASLGHTETLVGVPATTSHPECTAEERAQLGIDEGLVRYSCGVEAADTLVAELRHALGPCEAVPLPLPGPHCTEAELLQRVAKVQASMEQHGLDVYVSAAPGVQHWLTGLDAWSHYVPQYVVVHRETRGWAGVVLVLRAMDVPSAACTYLPASSVVGYGETLVHAEQHPSQVLVEALGRWPGRLGLDLTCDAVTFMALQPRQPQDAKLLGQWARLVKSDTEVACMRAAGQRADEAFTAALQALRPGSRQCDVAAAAVQGGMAGRGGDMPGGVPPLVVTGAQGAAPHPLPTEATIPQNQTTFLELSGTYKKYCCPIARTVYTGAEAPAELMRTHQAAVEALDAALARARPGNTAEQVWFAFEEVLSRHGLSKESRLGYSIGVGFSPDWGEQTVSIRAGDTTVLEKNMCFHLIAGLWGAGGGYELSEAIVITDAEPERLCATPRRVFCR